jgi:predicted transcriptional regulator YdeE
MNPVKMRIVEKLDNDDEVITYFDVLEVEDKYYYVYNEVNHGPFDDFEKAVEAAYEDLIPQPVSE